MDPTDRTVSRDAYRVLPKARLGLAPMIGLGGLLLAATPLFSQLRELGPSPEEIREASVFPAATDPLLQLVVHIQDSGFFIEGADDVLTPGQRRVWCESDRCDEADMRELTARLATVKDAHPTADHVAFVAGMAVPFGRVQAAMNAARSDRWDTTSASEPRWLFPRVTVQPDPMGQDRFLRLHQDQLARL